MTSAWESSTWVPFRFGAVLWWLDYPFLSALRSETNNPNSHSIILGQKINNHHSTAACSSRSCKILIVIGIEPGLKSESHKNMVVVPPLGLFAVASKIWTLKFKIAFHHCYILVPSARMREHFKEALDHFWIRTHCLLFQASDFLNQRHLDYVQTRVAAGNLRHEQPDRKSVV